MLLPFIGLIKACSIIFAPWLTIIFIVWAGFIIILGAFHFTPVLSSSIDDLQTVFFIWHYGSVLALLICLISKTFIRWEKGYFTVFYINNLWSVFFVSALPVDSYLINEYPRGNFMKNTGLAINWHVLLHMIDIILIFYCVACPLSDYSLVSRRNWPPAGAKAFFIAAKKIK